jgi:hypothetical protein
MRAGTQQETGMRRFIVPFALVALAASTAGCSFSESSKSSSDIISSPFKSSSDSLGGSGSSYGNQVKEFTGSYVKSGGDLTKLQQEVGKIAAKSGISDWENTQATWVGIGQGLKAAGTTPAQLQGYLATLGLTPQQTQWLQTGYGN